MNKIGDTNYGGVLIEMSRQEFEEFKKLAAIEKGATLGGGWWMVDGDRHLMDDGIDLTTVFGAIRGYMEGRILTNSLRHYTEKLIDVLERPGIERDAE